MSVNITAIVLPPTIQESSFRETVMNPSQVQDPRFLRTWQNAGALGSLLPGHYGFSETELFKPEAVTTIPARATSFDVAAFYRSDRVTVDDTFASRKPLNFDAIPLSDAALKRRYISFLLKKPISDKDIRQGLPAEHLSTLEDIAELIAAQSDGSVGFLGTSVRLFYVEQEGEIFTAKVIHSNSEGWLFYKWELGVGECLCWYPPAQVCFPIS